jgi:ABC-2 type transport system permease protein
LRLKVDHLPIGIADQEQTYLSAIIKDRLRRGRQFRVVEVGTVGELKSMLQRGEIRLGLVIPDGFSARVADNLQTDLPLLVDGSMPTIALSALQGMSVLTGNEASEQLVLEDPDNPPPPLRNPPVALAQEILFNPDLRDSDFFLPGTIGLALMIVMFNLTLGLVREREQQTIEQLLVTPIPRLALILGKLIPYAILGVAVGVVVVGVSRLVFDLPFRGSIGGVVILAVLFIFASLALGTLIATATASQQEAQLLQVLIIIPSIMMSGLVFPLEAIPRWLQPVSWGLPLTYFIDAMRGYTLKGASIGQHMTDFGALAAFAVAFTALSVVRFRKQLS